MTSGYSDSDFEDFREDDDILVIGIDFGTTYSGVAWASKADFESQHINLITSWPGSGREEGKAPTELYYEDGKISWGFEVDSDIDAIKWFKLLLLKEEDLSLELRSSEFLLRARKMMRENDKTAIHLISDYLRMIWNHALETITKDRGSVVEALQFHVAITVPAIWKNYVRQDMAEASRRAGILNRRNAGDTKLTFAPEPEAAALLTLCEPGRRTKPNEVYLVCDAGGGTVDLITYKIGSVNPILMNEAVEGSGGLCGGIFIDEAFEYIIKNRLGRRWDRLSRAGIKELLKGEWELSIKPQFKPTNSSKEYLVSVPAEAFGKEKKLTDTTKEPYIKNGRIHFNESHILKAFNQVLVGIDKLIDAQVHKARDLGQPLNGIILVGGLGSSPYLYDHLKTRHERVGIKILQSTGMRPRTAICRGAVYKGFHDGAASGINANGDFNDISLPIRVTSTISRASYGHECETLFIQGQHLERDKKWCELEKRYKALHQMQWYLVRGENVSTKEPISQNFYRLYSGSYNGQWDMELFQCEDDSPPSRIEPTVKRFATIDCRSGKPYSALRHCQNSDGESFKALDFEVRMVPSGASVEFGVFIDGKRVGKSDVYIHTK
ncbi:actin-like ATPase domain protein [Fusarium beomiforme]|uniref:Actin-like ATPase domain protein n=1 Tax=Fusarium beomiforme TaxID=44412 RepID=A0A9P5AHZ2_9HYPO|nr:actin-like ATPase domain protein [Fusarium beomiforme]